MFWSIFVCYDSYPLCNCFVMVFCMLTASIRMYFDLTFPVSMYSYLIDGMNK
jgi:hypothetical protein